MIFHHTKKVLLKKEKKERKEIQANMEGLDQNTYIKKPKESDT